MRCLDCFSLSVARFSAQARYTNQLRLTPAIAKAAADILATVQKLGVAEGCDLCAYWAQCWLTCLFIVVLLADDADSIPAAAAAVHSLLATAPIAIATWSRWQIAPAVSIRARLSTVCSIFTVLANCSSPAMQPGHAWKYAAPALTRALLATRLAGDFLLRFCSGQSACRQPLANHAASFHALQQKAVDDCGRGVVPRMERRDDGHAEGQAAQNIRRRQIRTFRL